MLINDYNCLGINIGGHLTIGGADTVELAAEYGTPAYIIDENEIRLRCGIYKKAMAEYGPEGSRPVYASKALSFTHIYRIMHSENMFSDVVSPGEICTAMNAGFNMENVFFHGNNKTDSDIKLAVERSIGTIVVDNQDELDALNSIAGRYGKRQRIMLRITPGIDPHTHKAISTGNVDSKFGAAISTGQALAFVKYALTLNNVYLCGLHCHIGSLIFDIEPFVDAVNIMMNFIAEIKTKTGYVIDELNIGGGFGVKYIDEHRGMDIEKGVKTVCETIKASAAEHNIKTPVLYMEPGRSIVAPAGITIYTVGSVKEIKGFRNYVSVDGGMPDNPRYALYQSQYDAVICSKAGNEKTYCCTIAGRCCESGDLIGENMMIQPCKRGDLLAVLVTGAYNYSMASNYNRIPRPPVIMVKDGTPYIAVERESYRDLIRNDK